MHILSGKWHKCTTVYACYKMRTKTLDGSVQINEHPGSVFWGLRSRQSVLQIIMINGFSGASSGSVWETGRYNG